jgi:hypothetical protein
MKIGEALRTQASSLYSATPIGAPMHPAPIGVADRTRKKIFWRTVLGQHCLLARGTSERLYIGAQRPPCANKLALRCPLCSLFNKKQMLKRSGPNSSVRLPYFQANRLLTELYKQETEIR